MTTTGAIVTSAVGPALGLQLRELEQVGATEGTALGTKLGPKDGRAVGPALRLQLGVAEETLAGALARAGALDGEQVRTTEGTPLGDCSLVSPWEHRKEHWRAKGRSSRRKTSRSHQGHCTRNKAWVPRSVPRWDYSSESRWKHWKEHWRSPRTEHWTENKSEPPRERHSEPSLGRRTVPRSVPRWDCSLVSPRKHW